MRKTVSTLLISVSLILAPLPSIASADQGPDYDIPGGHFYTQTNGSSQGARGGGYAITDSDGVPFWTFFSRNGGVDLLGYPVSQRFVWDGFVCQATQRAILQWNPARKQVQLANVFDFLSQIGKDDWLYSARLAPKPERSPQESHPLSFLMLAHYRFAWLYSDSAIFHRYFSTPGYYSIYGLPTSPVVDLGPYYAERFQRVVMYHWKSPVPWADRHGASVGLAGDLLKEVGLIPVEAAQPRPTPPSELSSQALPATSSPVLLAAMPPRQTASQARVNVHAQLISLPLTTAALPPSGPILEGVSTWYGADFQGRPMSDGRIYDMWNPHTAASNLYPLDSWVRITRLSTNESIVVEVTDHGAFRYPNVADLSYAAFAQLANPAIGVIGVRIEPVPAPD